MALLVLFVVAHVAMAAAGSFAVLLVARVAAAATHGAFFGIAAVMAVSLVDASSKSRALALMFGGLTIATVLGVPVGTLLGQATNWRVPFVAVAVLRGAATLWIALVEPASMSVSRSVRSSERRWSTLTTSGGPLRWPPLARHSPYRSPSGGATVMSTRCIANLLSPSHEQSSSVPKSQVLTLRQPAQLGVAVLVRSNIS